MAVGIIYEYQKSRIIHPTEWYFFTVNSENVDIHSPTYKVIIDSEVKMSDHHHNLYLKNCRIDEKIRNFASRHRNIRLCNPIKSLSLSDFEIRRDYFIEKVDELWKSYYMDHAARIFSGLLKGIIALFFTRLIVFLFSWVRKGEKS
tara:strand:+ start:1094 stop:1531 length:438 start_codon:yes stop_codon:yes gene_type:complete